MSSEPTRKLAIVNVRTTKGLTFHAGLQGFIVQSVSKFRRYVSERNAIERNAIERNAIERWASQLPENTTVVRDVGFYYSTNPTDLQGVFLGDIKVSCSLAHVGLTIVNRDSGNSLQLRPGSSGGDTVNYALTSEDGTTIIEDDFLYPLACDSESFFSSINICDLSQN